MDYQLKRGIIITAFGVTLYALLMHLGIVWTAVGKIISIFQPIITGGILAFILNIPMAAIERFLEKLASGRKHAIKSFRGIALLLTTAIFILVFAITAWVIVPELIASVSNAAKQVQAALPSIQQFLERLGINSQWLSEFDITKINSQLIQKITSGMGVAGTALWGTFSSAAGKVVSIGMAAVFMFYFLICKELLARHTTLLLRKIFTPKAAEKIIYVFTHLQKTFSSFLSSQCKESAILGIMLLVAFWICRLPYAGLVAILTAVTAMIPYVGAFISCGVCVFLILLVNPWQALFAFCVYQAVQFVENQFIYPKVVGDAVGLPAIYTILAVFIGGALFGIVGMIFFIPLTATFYTLIVPENEQ